MRNPQGKQPVNDVTAHTESTAGESRGGELHLSVPRLVTSLALTAVALTAVYVLTQESAIRFFPLPEWLTTIYRFFDVDEELSIPTWFSQILLLLISVFSVVAAKLQREINPLHSRAWGFLAVVFLIASLDEGVGFHEMLVGPMWVVLGIDDAQLTMVWILPALLVVALSVLVLAPFLVTLDRSVRRLIIGGGIVFLTGAVVIELLSVVIRLGSDELAAWWARVGFVATGLEELLEMLGAIVILWGVATQIARLSGSIRLSFLTGAHERSSDPVDAARTTRLDEAEH